MHVISGMLQFTKINFIFCHHLFSNRWPKSMLETWISHWEWMSKNSNCVWMHIVSSDWMSAWEWVVTRHCSDVWKLYCTLEIALISRYIATLEITSSVNMFYWGTLLHQSKLHLWALLCVTARPKFKVLLTDLIYCSSSSYSEKNPHLNTSWREWDTHTFL